MTQEAYSHWWWHLIDFCRPVSSFLLPNHQGWTDRIVFIWKRWMLLLLMIVYTQTNTNTMRHFILAMWPLVEIEGERVVCVLRCPHLICVCDIIEKAVRVKVLGSRIQSKSNKSKAMLSHKKKNSTINQLYIIKRILKVCDAFPTTQLISYNFLIKLIQHW